MADPESTTKYQHVDQLLYDFALPNPCSNSHSEVFLPSQKLKIANIILRWKIPSESPMEIEPKENESPNPVIPIISPCFPAGKDVAPSHWKIHVMTNNYEKDERMLSVFLQFYEYLEKDKFSQSADGGGMKAIYIIRLLDPDNRMLVSRRSGIRHFSQERLCYGWKDYINLGCPIPDHPEQTVQTFLESGKLKIEVDLTILQNYADGVVIEEQIFGEKINEVPGEPDQQLVLISPEERKEEEPIEWITITCRGETIADGNKKKLIENSGYFKNNMESILKKTSSGKSINIESQDPTIMNDVIIFLNGNADGCRILHSNDHNKLEELIILSNIFIIPALNEACFNAISHLDYLTTDQAIAHAIRSKILNLSDNENCKFAMVLLRRHLFNHIYDIKTSPLMKANLKYADWIAECIFEAD